MMPMIIPAIAPLPIPSLFQNKKEQRKKEKNIRFHKPRLETSWNLKNTNKTNKQTKTTLTKKKAVPPFLQHFHLPTEKSNGKHR